MDYLDQERTFGPVFNDTHFLVPLLELQQKIENLVSPNGYKLADVCNKPLTRSNACNIQNIWAYWQDSVTNLNKKYTDPTLGRTLGYLDHFLSCANNPTLDEDSDRTQKLSCMSKGGLPIEPFYILGGFLEEGETTMPPNPKYEEANTVLISILVDNYDTKSDEDVEMLERAMEWEETYLDFMKNFTSEEHEHMDIAFMSERSPADELDRETYGDIITIVLSYLFMFIYITISLGSFTKWNRVMVRNF